MDQNGKLYYGPNSFPAGTVAAENEYDFRKSSPADLVAPNVYAVLTLLIQRTTKTRTGL